MLTSVYRLAAAAAIFLLVSLPAETQGRDTLVDAVHRFAAEHFDQIQSQSIADNAEYCGLLGYDGGGALAATTAKRGRVDSCLPADEPDGFEVIATYHTHGAYTTEADIEVPSPDDLLGDIEEGLNGYIATPGGRLWLNETASETARLLCGVGCVTADPRFIECAAYLPGSLYTTASLEQRADDDTGEC